MEVRISYWTLSRSPYYSFIFVLPFLAIYEVMILILNKDEIISLRNGADVLMRQFLALFGEWGFYVLSISYILVFLLVFLIQKKDWNITVIKSDYLIGMLAEGTVWGFILYIFMKYIPVFLMFPSGKELFQQMTLAIGAGLYEELVFRVISIAIIFHFLRLVFQWNKQFSLIITIIISGIIFSAFHFAGPYGDDFTLFLFIYRLLAGIILGIIYVIRGFGIVSYAHMIYNFIIIFTLTTS
tara:strand:+ start:1676 stop:2395 length:720 start_codon:yes stop_codon:yes gene_type:complete